MNLLPVLAFQSRLRRLWDALTRPPAAITGQEARQDAQLLLAILFALIVIGALTLASQALLNPTAVDDLDFILTTGIWLCLFGLYAAVCRGRVTSVASVLVVLLFILFTVGPFTANSYAPLPYFIVVPILLSSLLSTARALIAICVSAIAFPIALLYFLTPLGYIETHRVMEIVTYTVMVSGVVLVYHFHRSAVERTRLHELQTAYQRVRQSEIELERRVEERTRQLRASELNWRTLTVNSPDTIIRITPDRRVSFFQHPLLTVEGNEQALVGYPILDLYLPETRQSLSDALDRTFATGELQEVEVLGILDPSAETQALFQNRIIPLRSEGQITGAMIVATDITQRSRMEESLRVLERAVSHGAAAIIISDATTDMDLPVIYINDAVTRITGYTREDFVGNSGRILFPSPRETPEFQRLRASFRDRIACNALVPAVRKDGTTFWSEIWQSPVSDDSGTVTHFVSTLLDVTDRVVAQHNQSQLLEQLEVSNRDLRDFAYIVSHDLKAPLRGIGSIAAWLVMDYADRLDDDGRRLLELLRGRVQRMDALISGILEYSRIGRTHEQLQTVDIGHLVAQVVDEIVPPAAFDVSISPDLPHLSVEPIHLRQVFQNLLANAVAYTDKPRGQIRIACDTRDGVFQFLVSDNGPGIEERFFARIFQMFQTLTPRDEHESTGLGLAIVKRIVENWGGKAWVEAVVGAGSTFLFTIPNRSPDAPA